MKKIFYLLFLLLISCAKNESNNLESNNTSSLSNPKITLTKGITKKVEKTSTPLSKDTIPPSFIIADKSKIIILKDTPTFEFWYKENEIETSTCNSIIQDKKQTYWFGTLNGIGKLEGNIMSWITEKQGLSSNSVNSIIEDRKGGIWIGTSGGGLSYYDGVTFTNFTTKNGLPSNTIYRVYQDNQNNLWLGTSKGVSLFNGKSFINYSENEGFSNLEVKCIIQDKHQNMWFGTFGEGVFKYDGKKFTNFTTDEGLSGNAINCLFEDTFGNILIGCFKSGLTSYDGKSMITIPITTELRQETLDAYRRQKVEPSNAFEVCSDIRSIIKDKSGTIWLGFSHGIGQLIFNDSNNIKSKISIYLDLSVWKNTVFDYESCNINSVCLDNEGDILWGIEDKIRKITPSRKRNSKLDSIAPLAFIKNIKLFNEEIKWYDFNTKQNYLLANGVVLYDVKFDRTNPYYFFPENLSLAYDNNNISFDFNAVNITTQKISEFKYKLEGLQDNWTSLQTNSEVPFNGLSNGKYSFIVKAMNKYGIWSEPVSYNFTIRPPWWHTWWFRSISILIIIIFSYSFFRWRTNSLRERQKQLEETVKERTEDLVKEKKIVEQKQKEIIDSIHYARRIQRALITSEKYIDKKLKDLMK